MKWWPGALAHTSTHAAVFARLVVGGKDHGVHSFMVPIRSSETFEPLPGIEVVSTDVVMTNFTPSGFH